VAKKSLKLYVIFAFGLIFGFSATSNAQIYRGDTQAQSNLQDLIGSVKPGSVLVIGEMHGLQPVRDQQIEILTELRAQGHKVSTGMEFFNYTDQVFVDQYRLGEIDEATFLKAINWSGYDFGLYKDQLLYGEFGLGLNLTRDVTKVISKQGVGGLSADQASLLPPDFTIGRDSYRQRFFQAMGHPVPVASLENYFVAQSAWDDTMAWQTALFKKKHPDQTFVIIVGEFHVQFGGGLPERLKVRFAAEGIPVDMITVSQIYTEGMTEQEIRDSLQPSVDEGARANFIWLSK
jgi:uncharacterized iron-regulated protein